VDAFGECSGPSGRAREVLALQTGQHELLPKGAPRETTEKHGFFQICLIIFYTGAGGTAAPHQNVSATAPGRLGVVGVCGACVVVFALPHSTFASIRSPATLLDPKNRFLGAFGVVFACLFALALLLSLRPRVWLESLGNSRAPQRRAHQPRGFL
jgi:hypothetical protein